MTLTALMDSSAHVQHVIQSPKQWQAEGLALVQQGAQCYGKAVELALSYEGAMAHARLEEWGIADAIHYVHAVQEWQSLEATDSQDPLLALNLSQRVALVRAGYVGGLWEILLSKTRAALIDGRPPSLITETWAGLQLEIIKRATNATVTRLVTPRTSEKHQLIQQLEAAQETIRVQAEEINDLRSVIEELASDRMAQEVAA
jgi:hypothetical protein